MNPPVPPLRPRTFIAVAVVALAIGLLELRYNLFPGWTPFLLVLAGPAVAFAMKSERAAAWIRTALVDLPEERSTNALAAYLGGAAILIGALVFLEIRDPYYFTQDDNYSMGPVAIAAGRSFYEGTFPTWNPYQFLGQPTSPQSIYGLTYPVTYAAFGLARLLGGDHLYIEVFVLLHILGGYAAMVWAGRSAGVRPVLAAAAALSFVLSGTVLMIVRSYATMSGLVVWGPLLIVLAERLRRRGPSLSWALGTAFVVGIFCHSGNGQMWAYAVVFFGFALVLYFLTGALPHGSVPWIVAAALFSISLALLLVVPQMWFMEGIFRSGGFGLGILPYVRAMLLPAPLVKAAHPDGFGNPMHMAPFYYAGTVLTLCVLIAVPVLAGAVASCRGIRAAIRDNVWLVCAGIALWLAFAGWAFDALHRWPIFDKFNGPWKLLVFFHLFAAVAGARILDRIFATRWKPAAATAAILIALVLYNVTQTRSAFWDYGDDPYPRLPQAVSAPLTQGPLSTRGRLLPVAPGRGRDPGYTQSLMLDFPTYYGVLSVDGYDPFVGGTKDYKWVWRQFHQRPLEAARAYGVRWMLEHRTARHRPRLTRERDVNPAEIIDGRRLAAADGIAPHATQRVTLPDLKLFELAGSDPLAFSTSPRRALPMEVDQTGVRVHLGAPARATRVVVNFLHMRGLEATVDGREAAITADEWKRMVIAVPAGARQLRVHYAPPWGRAARAAAAVALAGALVAAFAARWRAMVA